MLQQKLGRSKSSMDKKLMGKASMGKASTGSMDKIKPAVLLPHHTHLGQSKSSMGRSSMGRRNTRRSSSTSRRTMRRGSMCRRSNTESMGRSRRATVDPPTIVGERTHKTARQRMARNRTASRHLGQQHRHHRLQLLQQAMVRRSKSRGSTTSRQNTVRAALERREQRGMVRGTRSMASKNTAMAKATRRRQTRRRQKRGRESRRSKDTKRGMLTGHMISTIRARASMTRPQREENTAMASKCTASTMLAPAPMRKRSRRRVRSTPLGTGLQ
jgi:hypothetical protein